MGNINCRIIGLREGDWEGARDYTEVGGIIGTKWKEEFIKVVLNSSCEVILPLAY